MADVDISTPVETVAVSEQISELFDFIFASVYQGVTLAENIGKYMGLDVSVVQTATATESVTTPVMALKLYRGHSAVTVSLITKDWKFIDTYRKYSQSGIPLKGLVLIGGSGGSDVFVIKDENDSGAYLYKGTVATVTTVIFPGSSCKPLIDFSECTLTAGHMVTFLW